MPHIAANVFDLVDRIAAAPTPADAWGAYLAAGRAAGFEYGAAFLADCDDDIGSRCYADALPKGWAAEYAARQCASLDPCVEPILESVTPFELRIAKWHGDFQRRPWHDLDRDAGIEHILFVPFRMDGVVRAVALCGREIKLDRHDRKALEIAGLQTILRLRTLGARPIHSSGNTLSERERECMHWVAMGKSDWQIGEILSLSEKTVNVYIERAKHKLQAVTRAQAIVFALRRGAINP